MKTHASHLLLGILLFGGCLGSKPQVLSEATKDIVTKTIGVRVEVEGVAWMDKEGEVIQAKHFSALIDLSSGQQFPRSGTPIHVTGILRANDPEFGYSYRIVEARCRQVSKPEKQASAKSSDPRQ